MHAWVSLLNALDNVFRTCRLLQSVSAQLSAKLVANEQRLVVL